MSDVGNSLTQETTMRELEMLRQQIHLIKGIPTSPIPAPATSGPSTPMAPSFQNSRQSTTTGPAIPGGRGVMGIPLVVVGTKSDLTHEREVSRELITRMSTLWGVPFYETSAKRNWNVK
jgi:hypothetical protein